MPPLKGNSPSFDQAFDIRELVERQEEVERAVLYRIKKQENTYLHVVEADPKDLFLLHTDNWPLFRKRMAVWGWYL